MEKRPFLFWAGTAGLGKHHTGGYGWIGVCRVNDGRTAVDLEWVQGHSTLYLSMTFFQNPNQKTSTRKFHAVMPVPFWSTGAATAFTVP